MTTKNLQEAFCLAYHSLPDVKGRGTRAAEVAGYSPKSAQVMASQLLAKPHIKARLDELAGRVPAGNAPAGAMNPSAAAQKPGGVSPPPGANHTPTPEVDPDDPLLTADFTDPREFLRAVMNHKKTDPKLRVDAAKALMPFEHAKLGETGKKEQQKGQAAEKSAAGRFASRPPPKAGPLRAV